MPVEIERPVIKKLCKDIRAWYNGADTIKSWDFEVVTSEDSAEITLDFSFIPEEYNVYLFPTTVTYRSLPVASGIEETLRVAQCLN